MRDFISNLTRMMCLVFASTTMMAQVHAAPMCTEPTNRVNGSFEQGEFCPNSSPDAWSWDTFTHEALPILQCHIHDRTHGWSRRDIPLALHITQLTLIVSPHLQSMSDLTYTLFGGYSSR